jgi:hypothetical protein
VDLEERKFHKYTFSNTKNIKDFYILNKTKEIEVNQITWTSYILNDRIIYEDEEALPHTPQLFASLEYIDKAKIECLEGDCFTGNASKIRYYFKDDNSSYYEGPLKNNRLHGKAKIALKNLEGYELLLNAKFSEGVLVGQLNGINKTEGDSISMLVNSYGKPMEIKRYAQKNNKRLIFKWTPKNNHLYDLSEADVSRLPGEIEVTVLNPLKKRGYDYVLKTFGYMAGGVCFHNFNTSDGNPVYSEILLSDGKDSRGKYYVEGGLLRYQNGKYEDDGGAQYIRTNCE